MKAIVYYEILKDGKRFSDTSMSLSDDKDELLDCTEDQFKAFEVYAEHSLKEQLSVMLKCHPDSIELRKISQEEFEGRQRNE